MKKLPGRALALLLAVLLLAGTALAADWPQFLGDPASPGVSVGDGPRNGAELALRWEFTSGSSDPGAMSWNDIPGTPIVVGERVYVYSSRMLRMLDLKTGKELASAEVYSEGVNQFFVYIAYGEGKIFVPCQKLNPALEGENGTYLHVYDAETLESLYVTENLSRGQMQSPVNVHDGYVVTGTYGRNGFFACFTTEDEDPSKPLELKAPLWTVQVESLTSFSQNGSAFVGEYVYFGLDNTLYAVRYKTGEVTTFALDEGCSVRSTPFWSAEQGRLFVSANHESAGAAVYSFAVRADGLIDSESRMSWFSHTEGGGTQSAPVVYNGRLYLGGGGGMMGSAEPVHVLDAATLTEQYSVPVQCKGTPSVSTAFATEENGWEVTVYVVPYVPNEAANCSELCIFTDKPGQTKARYEIVQNVGRKQYCSQSVAIAEDGALVWYNDAGRVYCYENSTGLFKDTLSHWGRDYVAWLSRRGVINGMGDGTFAPEQSVTRAQFAQLLAKMSGETLSEKETPYTDVAATAWYGPAVAWCVEKGVLEDAAGEYRPNEPIRRDDMARMLYLYARNVAKTDLPRVAEAISFTDAGEFSPRTAEAISAMTAAGIINGMGDGTFAPARSATRAQAATMLTRFYRAVKG